METYLQRIQDLSGVLPLGSEHRIGFAGATAGSGGNASGVGAGSGPVYHRLGSISASRSRASARQELRARRAAWIAGFWLVQAAVGVVGWPLLFMGPSGELLLSPSYLWQSGVWIVGVMILQACLVDLAWVRARASAPRSVGLIAAVCDGLSLAIVAGVISWFVTGILVAQSGLPVDLAVPGLPPDQPWHLGFWLPFSAVAAMAVPLCSLCKSSRAHGMVGAAMIAIVPAGMALAAVLFLADAGGWNGSILIIAVPIAVWILAAAAISVAIHRAAGLDNTVTERVLLGLSVLLLLEAAVILSLAVIGARWGLVEGSGLRTVLALASLWYVAPIVLGPLCLLSVVEGERRSAHPGLPSRSQDAQAWQLSTADPIATERGNPCGFQSACRVPSASPARNPPKPHCSDRA